MIIEWTVNECWEKVNKKVILLWSMAIGHGGSLE